MLNYDLYKIFKENLITKSALESLNDLLEDITIVFDQYYQRNYVWNAEKATNFIESIILGFDIPPIVIFEEDGTLSEIIDGRQRFETIKRFINNEFKLKKSGLSSLKIYGDKYFKDLEEKIQNHIKSTYLRVFRYKISGELQQEKELIDYIKKEIFRRYNIGLTPLKQYEIEKAIFIRNDLNQFIKKNMTSNSRLMKTFYEMFFKDAYPEKELTTKIVELTMKKIRFLVALPGIPINYYSWTTGKHELVNSIFKSISNEPNPYKIFENIKDNIALLNNYKKMLKINNIETTPFLYEALYWIVSIIKLEKLDINIWENNINAILENIKQNIRLFTEEKQQYYKNIINRYTFMAKIAEQLYNRNFDKYITTSDYSKAKIKEARDTKTKKKIRKYLNELNSSKPDAYSVTIKTYLSEMQQSTFNLRPDYQRDDSMNIQKSSGIIESILLNFKIAPIYIFTKENGTKEVIDGQQRLLTILGFRGIPYNNNKGVKINAKLNRFKLTGLKYLKEYEGLTYEQLPDEAKKRILAFSLTIINLREQNMPKFEPVDLFIRLNNKPYPIKEHSFEMWNASVNTNIVQKIKDIKNCNREWFYLKSKANDKHMQNEEMITALIYLENSRRNNKSFLPGNPSDKLKIYAKTNQLTCALKSRKDISVFLENITNKNKEIPVEHYTRNVEEYIEKLKLLLENDNDISLKQALNNLICTNYGKRILQNLFMLWYIIAPLDKTTILKYRENIYSEIHTMMEFYKAEYADEETTDALASFYEKIHKFWNLYIPDTANKEEVFNNGNIMPCS